MAVTIAGGGRFNAGVGSAADVMYMGDFATEPGDLLLTLFKWYDTDTSITVYNNAGSSWEYLTKRALSSLRAQVAIAENLTHQAADQVYAYPAAARDGRECVTYQLRGVHQGTGSARVSADGYTSASSVTTLTLSGVNPGADGGMVVGFFVFSGDPGTLTAGSGWTIAPDLFTTKQRTVMVYQAASGAGSLAPQLSWTSAVDVIGIPIAFAAQASAPETYVTGYLDESARGETGLEVFGWQTDDPSTELPTKWSGVAPADALSPAGNPAARVILSPAPGGTTDGQAMHLAMRKPGSDSVSSFWFPGVVSGTSQPGQTQTLDSPAETLTMQMFIDTMTQAAEIAAPHYPEDPNGLYADVRGAFKVAPTWAYADMLPWVVMGRAAGGHTGPIDKLWVAYRNIFQLLYTGYTTPSLQRKIVGAVEGAWYWHAQEYQGDAPSVQAHPGGPAYGNRMRASEAAGDYMWHGWGAGGGPVSGSDFTTSDWALYGLQIRLEGDTLADLDAQKDNFRGFVYAACDFWGPGDLHNEVGHGKFHKITPTWRWVLAAVRRTGGTVELPPINPTNIATVQSELAPLLAATLPAIP